MRGKEGSTIVTITITVFLVLGVVPLVTHSVDMRENLNYVPHAPIRINSNADFDAAHGVVNWATGVGSPGNPWIIEGWDINGTGYGYCIYIGNTTDYFEVRNCYLHHASGVNSYPYFFDSGINLYFLQNGILINNTASWNNRNGICLVFSNGNTISNNTASSNNDHGICLVSSSGNTFPNNNASSNNFNGIYLESSNGNTLTNNDASSSNSGSGIWLQSSSSNTFTNNNLSSNYWYGICVSSSNSSNNTLVNNTASNNEIGIRLQSSKGNTITNNSASSNNRCGIMFIFSSNNTLTNNTMIDDGLLIESDQLEYWNTHKVDTSNTLNGKPIYYWKNEIGGSVPIGAGQIILANCSGVKVENQNVSDGCAGIQLGFSSDNTISNNTACLNFYFGIFLISSSGNNITNNTATSNNFYGIRLESSCDNNTLTNNNVSSNIWYGLRLESSNGNTITNNNISSNNERGLLLSFSNNNKLYHNIIINNPNQASDSGGTNQWDNGYPSGGNYWSNYAGVDFNSTPTQDVPPPDGIGDTPYTNIQGSAGALDNYPLMMPSEYEFSNWICSLSEGWNLISLPLIQSNESINQVLSSIAGKWDIIQTYDPLSPEPWNTNCTFKPDFLNDFNTLDHKLGFWINITEPNVNLTVGGYVPTSTTIPLYAGWNLVGYPTLNDTMTVTDALWGTGATRVEKFDAMAPYRISEVGPSYVMKPGEGYWVHVPADSVWIIDW